MYNHRFRDMTVTLWNGHLEGLSVHLSLSLFLSLFSSLLSKFEKNFKNKKKIKIYSFISPVYMNLMSYSLRNTTNIYLSNDSYVY